MKQALKSLGPVFNGHRMVEEYSKRAYLPSNISYGKLAAGGYRPAMDLAEWRMNLLTHWGGLGIRNVQCNTAHEMFVGEGLEVSAEVKVEGLGIEDIRVEIYTGPLDHTGGFASRSTFSMSPDERTVDGWYVYRGKAMPKATGNSDSPCASCPIIPCCATPTAWGSSSGPTNTRRSCRGRRTWPRMLNGPMWSWPNRGWPKAPRRPNA
jgi:hypothetical protein